jgi:hypothetical protein
MMVESEKGYVHCRTQFAFSGFQFPKFRFPLYGCTYRAATKDSQLTTVKAQGVAREAISSLFVCLWVGTLKKPTQAGGGFQISALHHQAAVIH